MASTEPRTRSALARRVYESFQAGDMDTVRALFTSDIAWHSPGQGVEHFHGIDAVMAEFGRLYGDTDGTFRVMVDEITEGDESVVVLARATGTRGDKTFDQPYPHVFHFRGDQVSESWILYHDQAATAAFWA
jgi:ketosteroid isomerase-like protein